MLLFRFLFKNIFIFFSSKSYRQFVYFIFRHGDSKRYLSKTISWSDYNVHAVDSLSFIWQYKEIFVDQSYQFKTTTSSPLIIDCGANIGLSCLYFKDIYPQSHIIAFEADPKIAKVLSENMMRNNCKDVEVVNAAVWNVDGVINLSTEGADSGSVINNSGNNNTVAVKSVKFKNILVQHAAIDMLKIDIEGAEYEVIIDCKDDLGHVKNLFIEYHAYPGQQQTLGELLTILTHAGFRYYTSTINKIEQPMVQKKTAKKMDLQVNIYAVNTKFLTS